MIRIDLGADDSKRGGGGGGNPLRKFLAKLRLPGGAKSPGGGGGGGGGGFGGAVGGGLGRVGRSVGSGVGALGALVLIIIAAVGAYVPHVMFTNYKDFLVQQHQAKMKETEERIGALGKEIAKLVPFQKELESYEAQKRLVKERLDVIRALLANRGTPVNVLDTLGQSLPQRAWVNSVDFDMKNARPLMTVVGLSFSNEDISDYVDKLSESVYLQEVNLDSVTQSKGFGSVDVKGFQIQVIPKSTRMPAAVKPEVKAKPAAPVKVPVKAPDAATAIKNIGKTPVIE